MGSRFKQLPFDLLCAPCKKKTILLKRLGRLSTFFSSATLVLFTHRPRVRAILDAVKAHLDSNPHVSRIVNEDTITTVIADLSKEEEDVEVGSKDSPH